MFQKCLLFGAVLSLWGSGSGVQAAKAAISRFDEVSREEIAKKVQAKDGVFRFVVCRASNIRGLAIERRDSMANSDTAELLADRFVAFAEKYAKENSLDAPNRKQLAAKAEKAFLKVAKKMAKKKASVVEMGRSTAAFLLAEIKHETIADLTLDELDSLLAAWKLSKMEHAVFLDGLIEQLDVGWAGNRYRIYVDEWSDPEKKKK